MTTQQSTKAAGLIARLRGAGRATAGALTQPATAARDAGIMEQAPRTQPTASGKPLVLPTLRLPYGLGAWVLLAVACYVFSWSVSATHIFLLSWLPDATWQQALYVQITFSIIERFFFAGNKNPLTYGVLLVDALINAAGLFIGFVPRVLSSNVGTMMMTRLEISADVGDGMTALLLAIVGGAVLAYASDKLFDMAMGGK